MQFSRMDTRKLLETNYVQSLQKYETMYLNMQKINANSEGQSVITVFFCISINKGLTCTEKKEAITFKL